MSSINIISEKQIASNNSVLLKFAENTEKYKLKVDKKDYFYLQRKSTPKVFRWLERWYRESNTRSTPSREKIVALYQKTFSSSIEKNISLINDKLSKLKEIKKEKNKTKNLKKLRKNLSEFLPSSKSDVENSYKSKKATSQFIQSALLVRLETPKTSDKSIKKQYKKLRNKIKLITKQKIKTNKKLSEVNKELSTKNNKTSFLKKQIKNIKTILEKNEFSTEEKSDSKKSKKKSKKR